MAGILDLMSSHEDVIGLDIGDTTVVASRVGRRHSGQIELREAGWVDFDAGASEKQLAAAIRRLWRENGFSTYTVCSCLRSRSAVLKYFKYPNLSEDELSSALRLEAEDALQLSLDKIVIDWHVNRRSADGEAGNGQRDTEGVLVAFPRSEVDRHLAVLQSAGLYPVVVDTACMAVSNLFFELGGRRNPDEVECLINLAKKFVDVAILFDDKCIYPRTIISRSAVWEEAVDYLIANLKDALKFYQFKLRQKPVQRLILCGRIPSKEDFLNKLQETVGLPVEIWDPLGDMAVRLGGRSRAFLEGGVNSLLVTSLGLALRRA